VHENFSANSLVLGLISEIPHAEQKQQQRWTAPSNNGQHRTATTYGTFCVIVQDMVGAKQTIEGVKQTTSVAEFTHLVSLKTGIQEEHIKLVSN
jgi:hypothetical protein